MGDTQTAENHVTSEGIALGIGEDPAHLAGRLEEYEHTKTQQQLSIATEVIRAYKDEGRAYIKKLAEECPSVLKGWFLDQVVSAAYPDWNPVKMEAEMEHMFIKTEKCLRRFPKTVARMMMNKYRNIPERMFPKYVVMAQRVKARILRRLRYAERKQGCQDEPMPLSQPASRPSSSIPTPS